MLPSARDHHVDDQGQPLLPFVSEVRSVESSSGSIGKMRAAV